MNCKILWRIALPALLLAGPASGQPEPPAGRTAELAIHLAPHAVAGSDRIDTVAVTLGFKDMQGAAGEPLLRLPLISSNVDSVATAITGMSARDDRGPLVLTARDVDLPVQAARDAETGGPSREWITDRATSGPIVVRYVIPANATLPPRGPAPPLAMSNDGGGMSGTGHIFLLLPPGKRTYRTSVDWDLKGLPAGSRGISSFGEGRVTPGEPLTPAQLRMTFYMAGRIGTYPAKVPASGFFAAWQGRPAFDARSLMRWTGTLYGHYSTFFGQKSPPPYGVFLRYNPINAGGGVGLYHSFVATFGKGAGSDVDGLKITLAHEMFHTFQPYIEQPPGLESSWFGEGLAVFYAARLALRYGLITPQAFLKDVNFYAGRYYTSAMATVPNSEIPIRFWADTRIRTLPYDRGMLYFVTVDAALRKASGGTRTLDALMKEMLATQKSGIPTTNAIWETLLRRELGEGAVTEFREFLGGKMPLPASDAFDPCFRRTSKPMRQYEVGFDSAVLAEPRRIVRGLVPGSTAEQAGLRNGDEIVVPVPQDLIQGNQTEQLELTVRRDGRTFPLHYLPRGKTVDAWQWERTPDTPDARCRL